MPILLEEGDIQRILAENPNYAYSLNHRLEQSLRNCWSPQAADFHRFSLMPPCGFPDLHGLVLAAGNRLEPDFHGPAIARRLVLVAEDAPHRSEIRLGGTGLSIHRDTGGTRITHADGSTLDVTDDHIDISAVEQNGTWTLFVNRMRLCETRIDHGGARTGISVQSGSLAVIQVQHRTRTTTQLVHFGLKETPATDASDRAAFATDADGRLQTYDLKALGYRNEWEYLGNRIYGTLLSAACLSDILDVLLTQSPGSARARRRLGQMLETHEQALDCAAYYRDAFCQWPFWRPCMADRPQDGDWDWNGWSNGTIPGALALAAALTGQAGNAYVRENFLRKGSDWIRTAQDPRQPGVEYFRKSKHWVAFSTNHGLVIYFSYFVGARLLDIWSDADESNQRELVSTLEKSLPDGGYLEGLGYLRFALGHAVPYYFLRLRDGGQGWGCLGARERQVLCATWEFVRHATMAPNLPFGNFGDNQPTHWREPSFVRLLASIANAPPDRLAGVIGSDPGHTDPFSALARALPEPDPAPEAPDPAVAVFPRTGLAFARTGDRSLSLMLNGSRPHNTHNKNNDLGGVVIAGQSRVLLRAKAHRAMHFNNAVCGVRDDRIIPYATPRKYHGTLQDAEGQDGEKASHAIATVQVGYPAEIRKATGLHGFRRAAFVLDDPVPMICLVSMVQTRDRDRAAFCFDIDRDALKDSGYHLAWHGLDGTALDSSLQEGITLVRPPARRLRTLALNGPRYAQGLVTVLAPAAVPVSVTGMARPLDGRFLLDTPQGQVHLDAAHVLHQAPVSHKQTRQRRSGLRRLARKVKQLAR